MPSVLSVTPGEVTLSVKATLTAPLGARNVTLSDAGESATCTGCLTIVAGPTLTAINPSSAAQGSLTKVTLTGTGIGPGADIKGPSGVTFRKVDVINSTTVDAMMNVKTTATTGTNLPVTLTNSADAGSGKVTSDLLTIT
jgi:hypothetical protein